MADVPSLFRLNIEVGDLDAAVTFYTKLLGINGRRQAGSRCYFECGPVTLQVLDVSSVRQPRAAAKHDQIGPEARRMGPWQAQHHAAALQVVYRPRHAE